VGGLAVVHAAVLHKKRILKLRYGSTVAYTPQYVLRWIEV
jgi:hypothetical protein